MAITGNGGHSRLAFSKPGDHGVEADFGINRSAALQFRQNRLRSFHEVTLTGKESRQVVERVSQNPTAQLRR